jgi:WD40 repeat protein
LVVSDVQTGGITFMPVERPGGFNTVAFSPDDRRLATDWDKAVKLWDAQTGQELFTLPGHTEPVMCVDFSRDGQYLASGRADQTVKLWDATSVQREEAPPLRRTLTGHTAAVTWVAFRSDGQY